MNDQGAGANPDQMNEARMRHGHSPVPKAGRCLGLLALLLLSACTPSKGLDWDLRSSGFNTSQATVQAVNAPPKPDARGVISYRDYQVAVAQRGDTVATVAARIGIGAAQLASFNALKPEDALRPGEILALPSRVATAAPNSGSGVDVTSIATTALDRVAAGGTAAAPAANAGPEPVRYQVKRGETAFTIARSFGISAKALGDWNSLGPDLAVREGQYLIIPTASVADISFEVAQDVPPGAGSATPEPPSAKKPLPDEATETAAEVAKQTPDSPDLSAARTSASAAKFVMPLDGKIIRGYVKNKNDGIDIAANAGSPVRAADAGTVAAITTDTKGTTIIVIKHANNILTVYAGVDGVKVTKGATVTRGQIIAVVRAGDPAFLHFEVRSGVESVDPMPYLQ